MYRLVFHKLSSLFPPFNLFVNAAFGKAKHCNTVRFKLCQCFMIGVTPTCAGTAISLEHREILAKDHPRLRGYYVVYFSLNPYLLGSPPLARVLLFINIYSHIGHGITPACAGTTSRVIFSLTSLRDHPRLRGYYIPYICSFNYSIGSPPLARVLLDSVLIKILFAGITPACAGTTRFCFDKNIVCRDHPRLRGYYEAVQVAAVATKGSPPLARVLRSSRW